MTPSLDGIARLAPLLTEANRDRFWLVQSGKSDERSKSWRLSGAERRYPSNDTEAT